MGKNLGAMFLETIRFSEYLVPMKQKRFMLYLFLFSVFFSAPLFSIPYNAGSHIVDVEVRNNVQVLITDAKVRCSLRGNIISIKASAAGYQTKHIEINVKKIKKGFFKRDITLPDVDKQLFAQSLSGEPLKSAYFVKDQFGFEPNEYGITVFVPKKNWPKPFEKKVDVFDLFWGVPLKNKCSIGEVEEYFKVKMTVSRKDLDLTTKTMVVVFDTSKKVKPKTVERWFNALSRLETSKNPQKTEQASKLSLFLYENVSIEDFREASPSAVPNTFQAYLAELERFNKLHRE